MEPRDAAALTERLGCCADEFDAADREGQLALFRLLAEGASVQSTKLARRLGLEKSDVIARLGRWHGVHTDNAGRIVAFQALSLVETPHRLRIAGRTLYAWCAWDTLFLPELIGRRAKIESTCPATAAPVTLRVGGGGPRDVSPADAVVSFLLPRGGFGDDTIASFCNFIRYFASFDAAEGWTAKRPGTVVVSIEEAFEIGRRTNAAQWGDALGSPRR